MKTTTHRGARRRCGFALIITIVLVAFLVLILVGLATFTRVETQVADNSQQVAKARQNALMALNIAIGQLQKTTGPDQRVTATADLQPVASGDTDDPASSIDLSVDADDTGDTLNDIDAYWRASRNRRWTGAWKNGNSTAFDPENPAAFNPAPALQAWLVSGNEQVPDTFKPTDQIAGLTLAAVTASQAAITPITGAAGSYRLLVGAQTVGIDSATAIPADLDRVVVAPQRDILSDSVPGLPGSQIIGHYAWWVGDEGVKARVNLIDPLAATSTAAANRARFHTAARPAIEAISPNLAYLDPTAHDSTAADYKAFSDDLGKIISPAQLVYLDPAAAFATELKDRFHDLSISSRGVLSDTKNGGLKTDLTYLFGHPDVDDFRTALNAAYGTNVVPSATYNPVLSPLSTRVAAQPADFVNQPAGNATPASVDLFSYTATWEQLWSFHHMGNLTTATPAGVFDNATGHAVSRLHSGTQHGIAPLVVQAKLFYRLRIVGGTALPEPDGVTMVNRTGLIHIDIIPIVVLANPYNVTLAASDYRLAYTGGGMLLGAGTPGNLSNPDISEFKPQPDPPAPQVANPGAYIGTPLGNNGLGSIRITIKSPAIEPGQALVFSLKDAQTTIPPTPALQGALAVEMTNDFLPTHSFTYDTGETIPAGRTRVALIPSNGTLGLKLYTNHPDVTRGDLEMLRLFSPRTFGEENVGNVFIVDPIGDGTKQGGGLDSYVFDATFGAGLYGDPTTTRKDQVGIFYQINYRALTVADTGATNFETSSSNGRDIARSWARTRIKGGSSAGSASFNPYLASHLLFDPANSTEFKKVRWGLYNNGAGAEGDQVPAQLAGDTGLKNIFYDVPRAAHRLSSLGQLQHVNLTGHVTRTAFNSGGTRNDYTLRALSFQNNYPIGNSYSNVLLNRDRLMDFDYGMSFQHDGSYLWNDVLADRFFFSTYPQSGAFDFDANTLDQTRLKPWRDTVAVPRNQPVHFRGDGNPATAANARIAAQNLLFEGAFNINSTSVAAWKALLSSLRNIPVGGETDAADLTAPFARTLYQTGEADDSAAGNTTDAWNGTVNLDSAQIDKLAEEIVLQVRRRGPFLSMAEFTNRRVIARATDPMGLGLSGALQSAIDRVINQPDVVEPVALQAKTRSRSDGNRRIPDDAARMPTGISGYPGYLLQGDVLSSLGSGLSARSDTFTIRTYGDVQNPVTGEVTGRAWCEATVQRTPDYVVPTANAPHEIPTAGTPNADFGRRYQIVGFRWLSPEDI